MTKDFDEIDILQLMKTLWEEKIKIFLITIFSIIIAILYVYLTPDIFNSTISIKANKSSEFVKLQNISSFLNDKKNSLKLPNLEQNTKNNFFTVDQSNNFIISSETILNSYMEEVMDYEELISVLKDYKKIDKEITDLSITNEHSELLYFIKSLNSNKKNKNSYTLSFKWDNERESIEIINKTLKLSLINFENLFFKQLNDLVDEKRKLNIIEDTKRINFLIEQSLIAKELNISENQLQNLNSYQNSNNAYYLRGYRAIDKEISLIQKRGYKDYEYTKKDINTLKEKDFRWVVYNIFMIDTYSDKNLIRILIISILVGLTFGALYIIISDLFRARKFNKKKNN